jgi:flavin-dependent dehydrogenase
VFRTRIQDIWSNTTKEKKKENMGVPEKPILIVGAGVSGLLLAQYLRKTGVPFRIFERDADLTTRGLGWGLTLHWSLPALRSLLPQELVLRLPEAYVDRAAVEEGRASTFPFFDLSTGELKASTPKASESQRIRVTRERFRRLLATDLDIQACDHRCAS